MISLVLILITCTGLIEQIFSQITSLRIAGNGNSGPIVVQYNDIARPVCYSGYQSDHDWSDVEASVACTQAGYKFGWGVRFANLWDVRLTIGNVVCSGDETTLDGCSYVPFENNFGTGCYFYSDYGVAGVLCYNFESTQHFESTSAVIESPSYNPQNPNDGGFTYIIDVPNASTIRIEFSSCQLQNGEFLFYGKGVAPPGKLISFLTNMTVTPKPFEIEGNSMWFRILRDLQESDSACSFIYEALDISGDSVIPTRLSNIIDGRTDVPDLKSSTPWLATINVNGDVNKDSTKMTPGAIVGLIVTLIIALLLIVIVGIVVYKRVRRRKTPKYRVAIARQSNGIQSTRQNNTANGTSSWVFDSNTMSTVENEPLQTNNLPSTETVVYHVLHSQDTTQEYSYEDVNPGGEDGHDQVDIAESVYEDSNIGPIGNTSNGDTLNSNEDGWIDNVIYSRD